MDEIDFSKFTLPVKEEEAELNTLVTNDFKSQFLTFLLSKDDNLLLQTAGCLVTLMTQSKVSQALLYHSNIFPTGFNMKSMLL